MNIMEKLDSAISEVLACDLDREDKIIVLSLMADICLEQARSLRSSSGSEDLNLMQCCVSLCSDMEDNPFDSYTMRAILEKEETENG